MCSSAITFMVIVIGCIEFVKSFSAKNASDSCYAKCSVSMHAKETQLNHYESVFEQYGYSDSGVPKNLDGYKTSIIPESALLRYVNKDGEWKKESETYYSIIYLGELKKTKQKVIIKEYTKKPDINDIEEEAKIMLYMSDYFPKLYGYVPHGKYVGNLSLVIEFIQNGETLIKALKHDNIELAQVLSIFHQLASAVKTMHERLVLHNDLHHKNIMVQWKGGVPKVRMIDTGLSSFRSGMVGRIDTGYSFYPPEYRKNGETTPSTDIFGLGYLMDLSSASIKNPHLEDLSMLCKSDRAIDRPYAYQVVKRIEEIAKLYGINLKQESFTHTLRPGHRFIYSENIKCPILNEREITIRCAKSPIGQGDMMSCPGIYKNRTVNVHLIVEGREYQEKMRTTSFFLVVYTASELDIVPKIHGMIFYHTNAEIDEIGIVQEYANVPRKLDIVLYDYGRIHWTILYRLKIALKISRIVLYFHNSNYVINNIDLSNFLYEEKANDSISPIVMLSDFSEIGLASETDTDDMVVIQPNTYEFDIHNIGELYYELFSSTEMPEELYTLLYEESDVDMVQIEKCLCYMLRDC